MKTQYDYICGCIITPDASSLSGKMFICLEMTCFHLSRGRIMMQNVSVARIIMRSLRQVSLEAKN